MFRSILFAGFTVVLALPAQAQGSKVPIATIESLIRSQQYDKALKTLKDQLRGNPAEFKLWTLEGVCFALQGNNSEAVAAFDHAVRISPNYVPALMGEIQVLYKTGDRRAIPLLERLVKSAPDDTNAQEMLAMLDRQAGDCRAAASQFLLIQDAIADHPDSLEAYGYCRSS